jgi:uncharacterized protein (TIGR03435 family)
MQTRFGLTLFAGLLLVIAGAAYAQTSATTPTFDAASVRQSPAPDMAKMIADLQAGKRPDSTHVDGSRATYTYMSLKQLIANAYKLRVYQINGPDWLLTDRFDIVARLPDGASKDDAPDMLRALLEDRFKLAAHRDTQERPVLALVVGKGGPKLKPSTETPEPIDESVPLKPGESKFDSLDGPVRLLKNPDGSTTYKMGTRGSFTLKFDGETRSMHMEASSITMKGFAVMMTSLGGGEGRQVVDMTGLTGTYQAAVDFPLTDLLSSLRDQGIDLPTGGGGGGAASGASDPEGGETVSAALEKLGLKLEKSRAKVEQLVIDHVEKAPSAN